MKGWRKLTDRQRELLEKIRILSEEFDGEFVVDIVLMFMPADGADGEAVDAVIAKARFGRFVAERKHS